MLSETLMISNLAPGMSTEFWEVEEWSTFPHLLFNQEPFHKKLVIALTRYIYIDVVNLFVSVYLTSD